MSHHSYAPQLHESGPYREIQAGADQEHHERGTPDYIVYSRYYLLQILQILFEVVLPALVIIALGLSWEGHGSEGSVRNGEVPYPLVTVELPGALDESCG